MVLEQSSQWMESAEPENASSRWQQQKEILKEKFKKLTDQDLNFEENRKIEMIGKLARRLGMSSKEIQRIIDRIL